MPLILFPAPSTEKFKTPLLIIRMLKTVASSDSTSFMSRGISRHTWITRITKHISAEFEYIAVMSDPKPVFRGTWKIQPKNNWERRWPLRWLAKVRSDLARLAGDIALLLYCTVQYL